MLHNKQTYKSSFKEKFNSLLLCVCTVGMLAYCMYLVSQLPLPL